VSLASSNVGQVHPVFGVLALVARSVEIARSLASGGVMPATGAGLSDPVCNRA
jgi:hypothetical protein